MNVIKDKLSNSPKPKKEKLTKCETIFDLDLTDEELSHFTAGVISKEKYLTIDSDTKYYDLYLLYLMRGDKKTAKKYYLMISEEARKEAEEDAKDRVYFGYKEGNIRQFTDEEEARTKEAMKLALR